MKEGSKGRKRLRKVKGIVHTDLRTRQVCITAHVLIAENCVARRLNVDVTSQSVLTSLHPGAVVLSFGTVWKALEILL